MNHLKRLALITGFALSGAAVSLYQTFHFFQVRNGTAGFQSFCTFGAFDCDAIESSPYAELIFGIPLSSFAFGFFIALAITAWIGRNLYWKNEIQRILRIFTGVSLSFSFIYLGIMIGVIGKLCLLCLVIDFLSLILFGLAWSMKPAPTNEAPLDRNKWKNILTLFAACVFGAALFSQTLDERKIPEEYVENFLKTTLEKTPVAYEIKKTDIVIGSPQAPITILKFADFQCPGCGMGAKNLQPILKRYPGKIKMIYKALPFDQHCNPEVKRSMHPVACQAAYIAYCANEQGNYKKVYETFFENQDKLSHSDLVEMAISVGIKEEQLKNCLASDRPRNAVTVDLLDAKKLKIDATPSFLVNGRIVKGALLSKIWIRLIDKLLEN
ncbi:MAG: hypothetical protein CL678_08970 [Bdellovibrionaceae bacterium]|nr:hypothetical protein [Pseudobdellovibrionaceae bacterium]|tara:strand:+ start:2612 stop:3760 length:1149 start_codon:yes stop_codon:yes gene_type:complete